MIVYIFNYDVFISTQAGRDAARSKRELVTTRLEEKDDQVIQIHLKKKTIISFIYIIMLLHIL